MIAGVLAVLGPPGHSPSSKPFRPPRNLLKTVSVVFFPILKQNLIFAISFNTIS